MDDVNFSTQSVERLEATPKKGRINECGSLYKGLNEHQIKKEQCCLNCFGIGRRDFFVSEIGVVFNWEFEEDNKLKNSSYNLQNIDDKRRLLMTGAKNIVKATFTQVIHKAALLFALSVSK
jgi:hypothetical protein